jgi:hypothetical protein
VVSGKEHVPVGQLIETCTEKCPNISQEIEDKPSSICNGVENVECEESLSHNTEEATFSGNSEVFVTSELLNKFSYPNLHPAARQFCRSTYTITDNTIK